MFKLFKRRGGRRSLMYKVFEKMGQVVEYRQHQCAGYLNEKVAHIKGRLLLLWLILFCIGFGSGALYVVWETLYKPAHSVSVKAIQVPLHLVPEKEVGNDLFLSDTEVKHIRSFLSYLDSLQQTPEGKKQYDLIKVNRPGLLDSLAFIQQLYREQLKTK